MENTLLSVDFGLSPLSLFASRVASSRGGGGGREYGDDDDDDGSERIEEKKEKERKYLVSWRERRKLNHSSFQLIQSIQSTSSRDPRVRSKQVSHRLFDRGIRLRG